MKFLIPCLFLLASCSPNIVGRPPVDDSDTPSQTTTQDEDTQETASASDSETIPEPDETDTMYKNQWKCLICE